MRWWLFAAALTVVAFCFFRPVPADAYLQVCNKTSKTVYFAYAHDTDYMFDYSSEVHGWWKILPDACRTPISNDLDDTDEYYYYANDEDGGTWSDQDGKGSSFCIDPKYKFDFNDSENSNCATEEKRKFRRINVTGADYTLNLTP